MRTYPASQLATNRPTDRQTYLTTYLPMCMHACMTYIHKYIHTYRDVQTYRQTVRQTDGQTSEDCRDEPDRPVAEVIDCLHHIGVDLDPEDTDSIWERARVAFACVCATTQRLRRTAETFAAGRPTQCYTEPTPTTPVHHGVHWDC